MSTQSTLTTLFIEDVKVLTTMDDFNEAIYDGWEMQGWEWDEGASKEKVMPSGRKVPVVADITKKGLRIMGYEAEEPELYAFMYGAFNIGMATDVANNIKSGVMILSHEVEGNGTEYYVITPGKAQEVDVVDAIRAFANV